MSQNEWDDNIYQPNNIYNSNCYEAIKSIPDKSIDLIYTDIPYDITYSGGGCLSKNLQHAVEDIKSVKETLTSGIDYKILDEFVRIQKKIKIYIWCSKSQIFDLMKFFIGKHKCYFNILVWCKTNPVPFGASNFLSDIEYCLCFYQEGTKFSQGVENKGKYFIEPINQKDKNEYGHPTIKPLEFVKKNILNATKENDIVFDPFMGSGTTAVACKETNRRYLGFEIDNKYYNIAIDRLNGITQKDRKLKNAGFTDIFDYLGDDKNG